MKEVDKSVEGEISGRLKLARAALSLNQKEFASKSGVGFSSYQKYEMGLSIPGGDAIKGFVKLGINANWLITGTGPMLLSELLSDALRDVVDAENLQKTADAWKGGNVPPHLSEPVVKSPQGKGDGENTALAMLSGLATSSAVWLPADMKQRDKVELGMKLNLWLQVFVGDDLKKMNYLLDSPDFMDRALRLIYELETLRKLDE